jgi:hypothetical protein
MSAKEHTEMKVLIGIKNNQIYKERNYHANAKSSAIMTTVQASIRSC